MLCAIRVCALAGWMPSPPLSGTCRSWEERGSTTTEAANESEEKEREIPVITGLWEQFWETHQICSQLGSSGSRPQVVAPSQLEAGWQQTLGSGWEAAVGTLSSEGGRGSFGGAGTEQRVELCWRAGPKL